MSTAIRPLAKFVWKPKRSTLPTARTCSKAEAKELLRQQVFNDAVAAGWLKPVAKKPNLKDVDTEIYAVADVQDVENRILRGEYPDPSKAAKTA